MPATINKQRILTQFFTALKKRYGPEEPEPRPVLEQLMYAICRENTTREAADRAFQTLQQRFFDWNEIRVSSSREIEEVIQDLPDAENRAVRLISLLQEVFETTFSFDLELLQKKGMKVAAKQLSRYQASNDYAIAWVVQQALGGHAIPLDGAGLRVLRRLGIIEADEDNLETLRASLEHLVPKAKGSQFIDLLSALADDVCVDGDPSCGSCPLHNECPTGQENSRPVAAGRRSKPR